MCNHLIRLTKNVMLSTMINTFDELSSKITSGPSMMTYSTAYTVQVIKQLTDSTSCPTNYSLVIVRHVFIVVYLLSLCPAAKTRFAVVFSFSI